MVTALASSDICVNSSEATVQDCFWSNDISQGISISPKQILYINPFITFPTPPSLIPFSYSVKSVPEITKNDVIHALIEAELVPETNLLLPVLEVSAYFVDFARSQINFMSSFINKCPYKKKTSLFTLYDNLINTKLYFTFRLRHLLIC